ncbi:unnamed protein product [Adineta ricciae]|uniref:Ionotropic glutamate receptor C-terminal domain-containing protein n=1 Tax=Adineta ricciae TaxID=249248 RepID=A0A815N638_ADIRI|nr:unnamed protein product [Adineta ricciae]
MFFVCISRYVVFYLVIGLGHVVFIQTAWPTQNSSAVQLLGLFGDAQNISTPSTFSVHSRAMFKTAIILAQQYDVKINGEHIQWQAAQTGGNRIAALDSVCQTVSNYNTAGIIGPAFSRECPTISAFADKIGIPVISYSATDPDLSDRISYPAFYRTVASDNGAAITIAKLFTRYNWTSAIIVHQNDAFGSNGAIAISAALSANAVAIRETIVFDVITRSIRGDLKTLLSSSSTRIVILWADLINTPLILHNAVDNDVLGPQYLWILSSSISFDTFNQSSYQKLIGILTVEPVIGSTISAPFNQTLLNAACNVWQTYEPETFPGASNIDYYALFAFDATWSLIQSLPYSCSSNSSSLSSCTMSKTSSYCFNCRFSSAKSLFNALNNLEFLGVSGPVKFSANTTDRINGTYYIAQNSQLLTDGLKFIPVLKYADARVWQQYTDTSVVIWPGNLAVPPSDRGVLEGVVLRIAIMESVPFTIVTYTVDDFGQNITKFTGYVPDLIDLLQKQMKFVPKLVLVPANRSYAEIIEDVANDVYDMMIGDVTITADRQQIVSFSNSIFDNSLRIIMRQITDDPIDLLLFMKPFSRNLWLTLLGTNIYAGLLVCLLEKQENDALQHRSFISLIAMGLWYAFGVIVGYGVDFHVRTAAGRLLTVGLYIVSIVFVATYTANLASYLTISNSQDPVSSVDDIKNGKLSFNRIGIRVGTAAEDYYLREISGGNRNFFALKSLSDLFTDLVNNNIDAAFIDNGVGEYATSNIYCNLTLIGTDFNKYSYGIVMQKQWMYIQDIDVCILSFGETGQLDTLREKWFATKICSTVGDSNTAMGIESLIGLFVTFGTISIISLLVFVWKKRNFIQEYLLELVARKRDVIGRNAKRQSRYSQ